MDLTKVINFDWVRIYRWLLSVAEPNLKFYSYLRNHGVDLDHAMNLLGGAIAFCPCSFQGFGRPTEDSIWLPVIDTDGETPLDVLAFSTVDSERFGTFLGLAGLLGSNEVDNLASYAGGQPCRLLRTPLKWLQAGCVGCAVVLDPELAKPLLTAAPGDLAAEDEDHARRLVESGAIDIKRLVIPVRRAAA
jgi:hypothetical protein